MKMTKLMLIFAAQLLPCVALFAGTEDTDFMRSKGMIFVVVGVILVALAGVGMLMFSLERRIRRLEEHLNTK